MNKQSVDKTQNKFSRGDVAIGDRLHDSTAMRDNDSVDYVSSYKVEGKPRPMLVIGEPKSRIKSYNTLDFTSQKPGNNDPDFILKENGMPRSFGSMLGFRKPSYLRIYPINNSPENKMEIIPEIQEFRKKLVFDAILKEVARRMMQG